MQSIVAETGYSYIEAVLQYCNENGVDPEYVKNLMTPTIKEKLEKEFDNLNMLK